MAWFKKKKEWLFTDPPNVAVITTKQIISSNDWIAHVYHDLDDGGWQFMGTQDFSTDGAAIVSLENVVKLDPTLEKLIDLPMGWHAWRETPKGKWYKAKTED